MAGMDLIFLNACKNGQKGVVQAFIKKGGIDFNKRDAQGCTPLFYACIKGARDIVKLLLDGGAAFTVDSGDGSRQGEQFAYPALQRSW